MRIGILGGTFDPVHNAHLALAEAALQQLKLNRVFLVLSPRSPFKLKNEMAAVSARLAMLRLAVRGRGGLAVATWELKRRGPSYTVTTLSSYKKAHPSHQLFLILGSDALRGFPRWKNPDKILSLTTLVVGRRPGATLDSCLPGVTVLKGMFPDVSSTALRSGFAKYRAAKMPVPPAVRSYILRRKLYSAPHVR